MNPTPKKRRKLFAGGLTKLYKITMQPNKTKMYNRHYQDSKLIPASAADAFAFIDDYGRLSSHMNKSSWMMGGGRMDTSVDAGRGQEIGSHIRMDGKAFGIKLFLDEVVTRREPSRVKIWETVGMPKLLIIDHYRMKAEIEPQENGSLLRVSIDYNLPAKNVWLGKLFGRYYAKWCVRQMIESAHNYFKQNSNLSEKIFK